MRILLFTYLFIQSTFCFSQRDTVSILMCTADCCLEVNDYTQANYYYKLALSYTPEDSSKGSLDNQIQQLIITVDSLHAYSCINPDYINLLKQGDSLLNCCEIASLRAFDQALKTNNTYTYPENRINYIIENSPEVQKKLLVLDARRKRKLYSSELDLANIYYQKGDFFKAMQIYESISLKFKDDTTSKNKFLELQEKLSDDIEVFEKLVTEGDSLYQLELLKDSKSKFESALAINKECNACDIKIKSINFLLEKGQKAKDWEQLKIDAQNNYNIGNYEMAQYQYLWLYKHDNSNAYASEMLQKIEEILEEELDERMIIANAKLLLEKADHEFLLGNYQVAKSIYLKIENRYSKSTEHLTYVKERIIDCQHYIDESDY